MKPRKIETTRRAALPRKISFVAFAVTAVGSGAGALGGCDALLGIPGDLTEAPADSGNGDGAPAVDASGNVDGNVGVDAGSDGAANDATPLDSGDSGPIAPSCNVAADFGTPVLLDSVSTAEQEGSPRLTEDELTMTFDGIRIDGGSPSFDVFITTRTSITDTFGPPVRIAGVNTSDQEYSPSLTENGLQIFYERQLDAGQGVSRIFIATRASTSLPFSNDFSPSGINSGDYTGNPFVRGDGGLLLYVQADSVHTNVNVYQAIFSPGTGYESQELVNAANNVSEQSPILTKSGLALYYASDLTSAGLGSGNLNIWVATRTAVGDPFTNPVVLPTVNTTSDDKPSWISPDGCRMYIASNRPGGKGFQDIYVSSRPQ